MRSYKVKNGINRVRIKTDNGCTIAWGLTHWDKENKKFKILINKEHWVESVMITTDKNEMIKGSGTYV